MFIVKYIDFDLGFAMENISKNMIYHTKSDCKPEDAASLEIT